MPNLASKDRCTGCTACISVCPTKCIEMKADPFGFSFPELIHPASCLDCGTCESVCPVLTIPAPQSNPAVYAAQSKNEFLRKSSSSGGIFSEIAEEILNKSGTVYGAAYNESFGVVHCPVETAADLSKLRGAKYAESHLGHTFSEVLTRLTNNQPVLFAGTPCQVAGLKAFLKRDYDHLLCVDFICHGVPSPIVWKNYVHYRAKADNNGILPQAINLRAKDSGWSRYTYSNAFYYSENTAHTALSGDSLYMKLFVGDYINRLSCAQCPFKGYSRISDITLGDFWGIWDIAPEMDDNRGTSLVLLHSEKGRQVFDRIRERITFKEMTTEESSRQNPSMLVSSPSNPKREQALSLAAAGNFDALSSLFPPKTSPYKTSLLTRLRTKLSNRIKGS